MRNGGSLAFRDQTGQAPVREFRPAALAVRRTGFLDLKVDALSAYFDQCVSEKPTVLVESGQPELPARTRHGDVRHAFEFETQQLVNMSGDHILDAVPPGKLV